MKVLLIDDDPHIRKIGELALRAVGGFAVTCAASGAEGLALACAEPPDVILLDLMMPHMDGVSTLAALQQAEPTASVPVVFFTARVQRSEIEHLLALGAVGAIGKPFDPMNLAAQVRALVEGAAEALKG